MEVPTHKEFPTRCRTQMPKEMLMLEEREWGAPKGGFLEQGGLG